MGQNESRKVRRPTEPFTEAREKNSRMSDIVHTKPNPQIRSIFPLDEGIKIQSPDSPVADKPKEFYTAQPNSIMHFTSTDSGETFHKPSSSVNNKNNVASSTEMLASTLKSSSEKLPKIEIASFDTEDSVKSSDITTEENLDITNSSPKQYEEDELRNNLPSSLKQATNYSNFPEQVPKDVYHLSKRNDQISFTSTSERRFLSSKLNADVSNFQKELKKENDQFHTKDNFFIDSCNSPTKNAADSINEISKNKTDQAIKISVVSCLPSSVSEISQKNLRSSNMSTSTPSFFDSRLLLPTKMSANSGNLHETNKANSVKETEHFSNQPTLNINSNSTDSHTNIQKKINSKIEDSHGRKDISKKNLRSNYEKATTSYPLKHIEKIANNVCSLSPQKVEKTLHISNKSLNEETVSSQQISLHKIKPNRYFSPQECIYEMANFDTENKEMICSLQQSLLINLQTMNSFLSVMKTFPRLNKAIIDEVYLLKENISSFSGDKLSKNMDDYSASNLHRENTPSITTKTVEAGNSRIPLNVTDMRLTTDIIVDNDADSTGLTVKSGDSLSKNTSLSFEHLSREVNSFNCEKREDRRDKLLRESQYQGNKKELLCLANTDDDAVEKPVLPQNYEEVLNIVYESFKKGLVLNISLYICRLCDNLANNEEDANSHLSSENHIKYQLEDAKWHICLSCCLNIFGTDEHFKEHYSTLQHNAVFSLKNPHSEKLALGHDLQKSDETFDCASVSSSVSNVSNREENKRPKPHEILLAIAKDNLNKNNGNSVGLYCQICNRYTVYSGPSTEDHFKTDLHIGKLKGRKNCTVRFCNTCNVHLFGDRRIWEEHIKMQLHLELSSLGEKKNNGDQGSDESEVDDTNETTELSNEEGPHFDLMKAVIKKHMAYESTNSVFGFYCHTCEAYFLDEQNWKCHINSASHFNRINSSEYLGKELFHECKICNIIFIGYEHVFSLHKKTVVHQAIDRLQRRGNPSVQTKRENSHSISEDESSEETDDSEDENATVDGSDSRSAISSNKKDEKPQVNRNGIHVTGLPKGTEQRDVFEVFKRFGFITKCVLERDLGSSKILFKNRESAQKALQLKKIWIKKLETSVFINPLNSDKAGTRRRNKEPVSLKTEVREVLRSTHALEALVRTLQTEMAHHKMNRDSVNLLIERDIVAVVPNCKVHFFGSQVTGLATKESDLDVYIDFDNRSFFTDLHHDEQINRLHFLLEQFTHPKSHFRVKEPIFDARVPIIRVIHTRTDTPCDISCRSGLSVENSQLIRMFLNADKRVRWLVVVVKWWMRHNDLLDRSIFTSYACVWLVIFFLMRTHILCSVTDLQRGCPKYSIAQWDCRFSREVHDYIKAENVQSELELLALFFYFYGSFSYKPVVLCPLSAGVIPRNQFENLQLPAAYKPYMDKINTWKNAERLRTSTPICLQDPFDLSHNITKGVNKKDLQKFKKLCRESQRVCKYFKN